MKFQLGDCCDLSFKDKTFDVVTTMNTIYFWNDTAKGMSEINRVLKDNGIFYNAVISKENLDKFFYTKNGFKKFTKDEYIELGKKAGFRKIRIKTLGNNYGLLIIYRK
jgi:ubiquinone/menaquinone biosynthesis C-methylase UbiE